MADHQLPRELMESCLAAAQEATFQGFDDSVLKEMFADPKRRRLFETVYRMGFESGWRIREQQISLTDQRIYDSMAARYQRERIDAATQHDAEQAKPKLTPGVLVGEDRVHCSKGTHGT